MSRESVVKSVVSTYEKLKNEWSKKNRNLETCGKLLSDIKVELTKLQFLPSMGHSVSKEELLLPESPYMYELLGLDLLCLLAQNKVGEFHTTLEHLPPPAVTDNVYIRHPVAMEQYLMEGAYNKRGWQVGTDGYLHFKKEVRKSDDSIPSKELANQMINYAREMEQIV
ncbi:26S proteasome non-ATPase regulatory subunit 8-like [Homarus americanus]|uniref:26S proteasome non-ATPase regulatory subunit 8-like n=1 Tax=Homarus americanus TaxID=6706 RepID=A0A8J5NCW1_HOMAM|nr:26S proteasome non-ATPase regulatory subunit 8-like [Homarus americanus]